MESEIRNLAKAVKNARDAFDKQKSVLAKIRKEITTGRKSEQNGEVAFADVEQKVDDLEEALKKQRDRGDKPQVYLMMIASFTGALTIYFLLLGLASLIHDIATWIVFVLSLGGGAYYITDVIIDYLSWKKGEPIKNPDIDIIEPDETGIKLFMGKPYRIVSSGPRYAPWFFVKIIHVPQTVFLYKIREDKVMTAGKESTTWSVNFTIRFRLTRDIWNLVRNLGTDINKILDQLMGHFDTNGNRTSRGIIGDELAAISRAWIGNVKNVPDIDSGLMAQEQISVIIDRDLELALRTYGLSFDYPDVTDFDPSEEIRTARESRTTALINVDEAKHKASAEKEKGKGDRAYQMAIAEADAYKAEKIIKAKIEALGGFKKDAQWAAQLLTLLVVGEDGLDKLKDLGNINLYGLEGIGGIIKQITSAFGNNKNDTDKVAKLLGNLTKDDIDKVVKGIEMLTGKKEVK